MTFLFFINKSTNEKKGNSLIDIAKAFCPWRPYCCCALIFNILIAEGVVVGCLLGWSVCHANGISSRCDAIKGKGGRHANQTRRFNLAFPPLYLQGNCKQISNPRRQIIFLLCFFSFFNSEMGIIIIIIIFQPTGGTNLRSVRP